MSCLRGWDYEQVVSCTNPETLRKLPRTHLCRAVSGSAGHAQQQICHLGALVQLCQTRASAQLIIGEGAHGIAANRFWLVTPLCVAWGAAHALRPSNRIAGQVAG